MTQSTRGAGIDRMTLSWDAAAGRYSPLRRLPLASLISPVFIRRREDKACNDSDVRLAQLSDRFDISKTEVNARQLTLPKSAILRREVYTKTLKGQTLVRKLLLWQTNKADSGDFPAYVLHLTDFSPTRKTPLERQIRVSSSREQIDLYGPSYSSRTSSKAGRAPVKPSPRPPRCPSPSHRLDGAPDLTTPAGAVGQGYFLLPKCFITLVLSAASRYRKPFFIW